MKKLLLLILTLALVLCGCAQASGDVETTVGTEPTVEMVTVYLQTGYTLTVDMDGTITEQICTRNYDENNHLTLVEVADDSGEVLTSTAVECNENGDIIKQTQNMNGQEMIMVHTVDDQGNPLTAVVTLGGEVQSTTAYTYNEAGQLVTSVTEFPSNNYTSTTATTFEGDRIIKQVTTDSNGQTVEEMNWAYSEDGLTVTITNGEMTVLRTLDEHGNILTQTTEMPGMSQTMVYSYKAIEVSADDPLAK